MYIESEWAAQRVASKRTEELRKLWYRRRMIAAEDAGDVLKMRDLQSSYHDLTGSWFETTLDWR